MRYVRKLLACINCSDTDLVEAGVCGGQHTGVTVCSVDREALCATHALQLCKASERNLN